MMKLFGWVLYVVPKKALSYFFGVFARWRHPKLLIRIVIRVFAKLYRLNMSEAKKPLESYQSLDDLFTRELIPQARPIGDGLVHPADSELRSRGLVQDGTMIQAKGFSYTLGELLGDELIAKNFEGGVYLTYYLCPTDYHRVHSPFSADVSRVTYLPGALWPVNDWSVNRIDRLFAVNERLVVYLDSPQGKAALVMVGATNVGRMTLSFDDQFLTNQGLFSARREDKLYAPHPKLKKGDHLGTFHMGSTVVLVYEKSLLNQIPGPQKSFVKFGESL